MDNEQIYSAIELCIQVGAIEECEMHESNYIDTMEFSDPQELVMRILAENPSAIQSFKNRAEMVKCIGDALDSAGMECGYCAKNRDS
jgi:hypothetical protein